MKKISHRIVLGFPNTLVDQPIIYKLVKDYNIEFNILKAYVTPDEEGHLVLELTGREGDYKKGVKYLKGLGVTVEPLEQDIVWNENKCIHCGACVSVCPTNALSIDIKTRKVSFNGKECIACLLCVPACPLKAIEVSF